MQSTPAATFTEHRRPDAATVLELLKPITWFAPMWAYLCGVVSSGASLSDRWPYVIGGILLAGPCICATSQAANDWFDREVDAINEPGRPIPSGRMPGQWGFYVACAWTVLSLFVALPLGPWAFAAAIVGLVLAWAYSAPPVRLKENGWWGNAAVGLCYEGLPWLTGAAVMSATAPDGRILAILALYSLGAHGIMTLNDFKSIEGDRKMGIRSLPATLGTRTAVRLACVVMAVPQLVVIGLLFGWHLPWHAGLVAVLLVAQGVLMVRLLAEPRERAAWYNATGTTLYVLGMLVAAFGLRALALVP